MLKKQWGINDVPETLFDGMPKLEQGKPVLIRTKGHSVIKDLETGTDSIQHHRICIALRDELQLESGEFVVIGIVENGTKDGVSNYHTLYPHIEAGGNEYKGTFLLSAGHRTSKGIKHEELLSFLWLTNQRDGKSDRNDTVPALFEIVDDLATAKKKNTRMRRVTDALNLIGEMTNGDIIDLSAAMDFDISNDPEVLRAQLMEYAISPATTDAFYKVWIDGERNIKADIKKGIARGVLAKDEANNQLIYVDGNIVLMRFSEEDWLTEASGFLNSTAGEEHYKKIKKLLVAAAGALLNKNKKP